MREAELHRTFFQEKKTYGYRERDELKRQAFEEQLLAKSAPQIVYVDEAGKRQPR